MSNKTGEWPGFLEVDRSIIITRLGDVQTCDDFSWEEPFEEKWAEAWVNGLLLLFLRREKKNPPTQDE